MNFNSSEYPFLKKIEENFTDKYDLLEMLIKNYVCLNKNEKEYINSIYTVSEEKIDNIIWNNISSETYTKNYKNINITNFNERVEAICYCKYYYENFNTLTDNEKIDFLQLINENIIYLLAQELNKNQNKKNDEILKNKDFVHKFYQCISNNSNLKKDLYLNHCLNIIMSGSDGGLLINFIKSFNKFSIKVFKNKEILKENRLFYEKYFCYLNPEYIYESSLSQEIKSIIFDKITPKNLNLNENLIFLNSLNKSIISFIEYYLEINKEITKEILFNENDYLKEHFSKLLGVYKNNLFEIILQTKEDNLKSKLIYTYKENIFEDKYSDEILSILNKNGVISKVILENMQTLDIEKQKKLLFNYIKKVIVENGDIEIFKENMEYMNKNLLKIFDVNFSCSILSSFFGEKESVILDIKNIMEKVKLKNKLEENLTEKNNYSRVKI